MADLIDSIKRIALLSIVEPDSEANLRRLYRWFSKTFNMAITEVEELPVEYILMHYYESKYEELNDEEKHDEIIDILETPEEKAARIAEEQAKEDDFLAELEAQALEERKAEAKLKAGTLNTSLKPENKEEEPAISISYVENLD